jgi:hypothetical protein
MNPALFAKFTRLLLALSVSLWMAAGCLFGCSNMQAMAVEVAEASAVAVAGESCHSAAAHDCCTKPQAAKQEARTVASSSTEKEALTTARRGMKDCPLMVNTTAITAKSSGNMPEPGRTPLALLPRIESQTEPAQVTIVSSYRPNRGPTHLRCCVFLI